MTRILLAESVPVSREPMGAVLQREGYEMALVEDGQKALTAIESARVPFDLLIFDVTLPRLGGLELLSSLRQDPRYESVPVILLSESGERELVLRARELKVSSFLIKSTFSIDQFLSEIKKASEVVFAEKEEKESPSHFLNLIKQAPGKRSQERLQGRTISTTAAAILRVVSSNTSSASDLAAVVKSDLPLTAKILSLSNSAAFSAGHRSIISLEEAIGVIGFNLVRYLATSLSVFQPLTGRASGEHSLRLSRRWAHSVVTGMLMEELFSGTLLKHTASMVGLLHELPDIVIMQEFEEEWSEAKISSLKNNSSFEREFLRTTGATLFEVEQYVLKNLTLPQEITAPISDFLSGLNPLREMGSELVAGMALCHAHAQALLFAPDEECFITSFEKRHLSRFAPVNLKHFERLQTFGLRATEALRHVLPANGLSLSHTQCSDEPALYIRHPEISDYDPIAIGLAHTLGNLTVASQNSIERGEVKHIPMLAIIVSPNDDVGNLYRLLRKMNPSVRIIVFALSRAKRKPGRYLEEAALFLPISLRSCSECSQWYTGS